MAIDTIYNRDKYYRSVQNIKLILNKLINKIFLIYFYLDISIFILHINFVTINYNRY